jgi:membrane AbrB-like protein
MSFRRPRFSASSLISRLPTVRLVWQTALMLAAGALGGLLAQWAHLPMPWMLGGLISSGLIARFVQHPAIDDFVFPLPFRTFFIGLIGVMIGAQVKPELLALAGDLPITLSALLLFVMAAHLGNMIIFRRLGGFDRCTAFYAGMPGGLTESLVMGEASGADLRVLTVQQFLRIILVISLLPLGLSLWLGHPVGSAAGLSMGGGSLAPVTMTSLILIVAAAILGQVIAKRIHLPAGQITGPLLVAATATVTGVLDLHLPYWLIASAQLVIGVSLGLRFKGVDGGILLRAAGLSFVSVGYMMLLGLGFAIALWQMTGIPLLHLFISFAPGGVAEMSVVALSLAANPALVSLHHVMRILIAVAEMPLTARLLNIEHPR